jgi:branched-chain amino acid transport system substrate-binding protein
MHDTNRKPLLIRVLAALAVLLLAASGAHSARAADRSPYPINVILSMTGQGAFVGQSQHDTLVALQDVENKRGGIQGHPIKFIFHDDGTSPQNAVQLVNAVISEHAAVLVGPSIAVTCRAVQPLVTNGPVTYCTSPSLLPVKAGFMFSSISSTHDQIQGLFRYFRDNDITRIAVLDSTDATGQDADNSIAAALAEPPNSSAHIVDQEHFTVTDLSVAAQFAKIKGSNPQVVISWTTGTPFATVLRGYSEAGLTLPLVGSPGNMTYAQMKQYGSVLPKDLLFVTPPYVLDPPDPALASAQREFGGTFRALGVRPDLQTGDPWDGAKLIILALRKLGTGASADQVRAYLQTVHDYVGIAGIYDFRDGSNRGLGVKDAQLARWDATLGTWVAVTKLGFAPLR